MRSENEKLRALRSDMESVIWPPVMTGAKASLVALLHELEETQWWPREKIIEKQFAQLAQLIAHAARHSPQFRERLQKAGLTAAEAATPEGFARLPPLTRRDIQAAGKSLYCRQVPKSHLPMGELRTSGSTGEPVLVRKTSLTNLVWMAMSLRDHFWNRNDFSQRLAVIRAEVSRQEERPDWGRPVNLLYDSGPAQLIPVETDIKEQVRLLREFRPQYLIVYPNNLAAIIDECERRGEPLPGPLRIKTTNETLSADLRHKAEKHLNTKINDIYSSAEMGNIALQCPESGLYHVMAENIILEVLDGEGRACAEGETGKVVVTDLANFSMPLIRYSINDYAEASGPCPCGRGLPTVRRFVGRERNLIVRPDGTRHWPAIGYIKYHEAVPVRQFQFIQHDPETLEVRLFTDAPVTPAQEAKLRAVIREKLEYEYKINFVYFDRRLPLGPNGKFEEFICKI